MSDVSRSASGASERELEILRAVDRAAFETDLGWVTASQVRYELDGKDGRGRWASALWELRDRGLLDVKGEGAYWLWGLTEAGAALATKAEL